MFLKKFLGETGLSAKCLKSFGVPEHAKFEPVRRFDVQAEALSVEIASVYRGLQDKTAPVIERRLSHQRAKKEHGHAEMTRL